ncbi:MAG: aminopeptidase [Anaerolineae bacterium]|jgi:aminopeptidase|nr:aminopeptidase [Anaerolineae bacterium]MBT4311024.1 aminopeptidase [Anaerolineae bacterium]MBT4458095.1 aminopeptidase [Anaerolineae bacterium]MBT4842565.1 aminopeptidase [Anaerolineae bacterium]MBT6321916.1 aminopeptidase [Anaerolineae bacterium]
MAIANFEEKFIKYAELVVKIGLNVQSGQKMIVRAETNTAPLVREITAIAYQIGSPLVTIIWVDEQVKKIRHQYAPRDSFDEYASWVLDGIAQEIKEGAAFLQVASPDPELLKGMDPEAVSTSRSVFAKHRKPIGELQGQNAVQWTVICPPTLDWAKHVFPEADMDAALESLWENVFTLCRLDQDDPVALWQKHIADLDERRKALTKKAYTGLHLRAPGTDLRLGLPAGHIWAGGGGKSSKGYPFVANIPTEEVFTLPHKDQTEGMVSSTRPLSYYGNMIENFSLTFSKGKVVKLSAEKGEDVLREMVETDGTAGFLGEVALLPHQSPISQSNIVFLNSLYDENASCHLALGSAYKFNLEGGPAMSNEEFAEVGGNTSLIHVDFMFGSGELDVDGIRADGTTEPVMRAGEWAFDL